MLERMLTQLRSRVRFRPSLSFILLCVFLMILWVAGGASRADVAGQIIVRGAAALFLIVAILFGDRPTLARARPLWLVLIAAIALALVQLIPLPPDIWQSLPGRTMLAGAAAASDQTQPWRPWSIVPGTTVNAACSLIVPMTTLLLASGLREKEQSLTPGLILGLVAASTLLGLLQFSGAGFNNPFINDTPGTVSASFANRNHFALFLAIGCLLVPGWVFSERRRQYWKRSAGLGLSLLFALTILATGSRAGIALGFVALVIGILLTWQGIRAELRRYPRWVLLMLFAGIIGIMAVFVTISVVADRAVSVDRIFADDPGQDMRSRGLPIVLAMIREYFPLGSGLGGFDPVFRMHEPFSWLNLTYFNHAHNDFLEIVLDTGLPGLLLLVGALFWWGRASVRVWRAGLGATYMLAQLGSAMLLLIIIASIFDYPARTPMIMALAVIAGTWLATMRPTLPQGDQHL